MREAGGAQQRGPAGRPIAVQGDLSDYIAHDFGHVKQKCGRRGCGQHSNAMATAEYVPFNQRCETAQNDGRAVARTPHHALPPHFLSFLAVLAGIAGFSAQRPGGRASCHAERAHRGHLDPRLHASHAGSEA
jgi:hypothetical protein